MQLGVLGASLVKRNSVAKPLIVLILTISLLFQTVVPAKACGPETIDPIFVFEHSPDLPFDEFVKGNIGILQHGFAQKVRNSTDEVGG